MFDNEVISPDISHPDINDTIGTHQGKTKNPQTKNIKNEVRPIALKISSVLFAFAEAPLKF